MEINAYQINKMPLLNRRYIVVLLNVSHPDSVEALFKFSVQKAEKRSKPLLCLYSDPESIMNKGDRQNMEERIKDLTAGISKEVSVELVVDDKELRHLIEEFLPRTSMIVGDSGIKNSGKKWRHQMAISVPCSMVRIEKKRSVSSFNLDKILNPVAHSSLLVEQVHS